jgi:hypothetical protein
VIECKYQLQPVPVFPGMKPVEITSQRMERIMSLKNGLKKRTPVTCWLCLAVLAVIMLPGAASSVETETQQPANSVTSSIVTQGADESVPKVDPSLQSALDKKVSLKFQNQSLEEVMAFIAAEHGLKIEIRRKEPRIDPVFEGTHRQIDYQCENKSLGVAITEIAEQLGLQMSVEPAQIVIELPSPRSRIRANESFILSNDQTTSAEEVIAYVGEVPIRVCDVVFFPRDYRNARESDGVVGIGRRDFYSESESERKMLQRVLHRQFPWYLRQEVLLQHFRQYLTPGDIAAAESYAEPDVERVLQSQNLRFNTTSDQERDARLAAEFSSMPLIGKYFKRHFTVQYFNQLLYNSDIPFSEDDIVDYGETILMQARFRKSVSVKFENADFMTLIGSISSEHDVPIRSASLHAEMAMRLSNPPVTVDIRDQPLAEAIRLVIEPRGMTATVTSTGLSIQHPAPEKLTEEFLSASPAAYGIFGLLKKTGWQPLTAEIRLKDAIALAGGVADPTNVDVEICHLKHLKTADGRQRHRILSLNSVLEDSSGEYNCVLNDGDVVTVRIDPNAKETTPPFPQSSVSVVPEDSEKRPSILENSAELTVVKVYGVRDLVFGFIPFESGQTFSRLVELIKTTVAPDSWGKDNVTIVEDEPTLSLIIRQTPSCHQHISQIIAALRRDQDSFRITTQCRIIELKTDIQRKRLDDHCSLHTSGTGRSWALLTSGSGEALLELLTKQGCEVLYVPTITTTGSGNDAFIVVGGANQGSFSELSISATPHPIPNSSVIRLKYTLTMDDAEKVPRALTQMSLVGSGQTLLLLIEKPSDKSTSEPLKRFVVMLTPKAI